MARPANGLLGFGARPAGGCVSSPTAGSFARLMGDVWAAGEVLVWRYQQWQGVTSVNRPLGEISFWFSLSCGMSPACAGWWMQGEWESAELHKSAENKTAAGLKQKMEFAWQCNDYFTSLTRQGRALPQNIPQPRPFVLIPGFILAKRNQKGVEELGRERKSKRLFPHGKIKLLLITKMFKLS